MKQPTDFTVIFEKLTEVKETTEGEDVAVAVLLDDLSEMEEINELRRLSLEMARPTPVLYSGA